MSWRLDLLWSQWRGNRALLFDLQEQKAWFVGYFANMGRAGTVHCSDPMQKHGDSKIERGGSLEVSQRSVMTVETPNVLLLLRALRIGGG